MHVWGRKRMESEKCLQLPSYNLSPLLCDAPFIQNSRCSNHVKCHTAFLHRMKGSYTSRMSVQRRHTASATLSDKTENTLRPLGPNRQYLNPASQVFSYCESCLYWSPGSQKWEMVKKIQAKKDFLVTWIPWHMMFFILDYSTIYSMRHHMPYFRAFQDYIYQP